MKGRWIGTGVTVIIVSLFANHHARADQSDSDKKWTFENSPTNTIPTGWIVGETNGKKTPATWEVIKRSDKKGQCVAITTNKNSGDTFNLLLAKNTTIKDVEISVLLKAIAGKEDQGGGLVWRLTDTNNYYICRWNPLEDNIRLYVVKEGKRTQLASATIKAKTSIWHEIEVDQEGAKIKIEFDDKEVISFTDTTFTKAGMVGLWVKADGRTQFDSFEIDD